jgi:hypothetical protein
MKETQAKRAAAEARLTKPAGHRRMTRDEITSLVRAARRPGSGTGEAAARSRHRGDARGQAISQHYCLDM